MRGHNGVAEGKAGGQTPARVLGLCLVLFLARIAAWALSDIWYDEIVTLTDFAIGPRQAHSILHVFRTYPVANNHVLFSAVMWLWIRAVDFSGQHWIQRLPSIVCGMLTLACIVLGWRKWLGPRLAGIAGLLFAVSPVSSAFAYQIRGYSLSMLLATLALTGLMEMSYGSRRLGIALHVASAVLLPLTIPSNALLVVSHLAFLVCRPGSQRTFASRVKQALPVLGALGAGAAYYLLIWPQFRRVLHQTAGWPSAWSVLGNVALGLLAHLGLLGLARLRVQPATRPCDELPPAAIPASRVAGVLAACCLLTVLPATFLPQQAPFPRVFLVFLPTASFAALLAVRNAAVWATPRLLVPAVLMGVHALAWERAAQALTRRQMSQGKRPQNLLQQYYRDDSSVSRTCAWIAKHWKPYTAIVLAEAHDFPAVRYYLTMMGFPADRVLAEGRAQQALSQMTPATRQSSRVLTISTGREEAVRQFRDAGIPGAVVPLLAPDGRGVFVAAPGPVGDTRNAD